MSLSAYTSLGSSLETGGHVNTIGGYVVHPPPLTSDEMDRLRAGIVNRYDRLEDLEARLDQLEARQETSCLELGYGLACAAQTGVAVATAALHVHAFVTAGAYIGSTIGFLTPIPGTTIPATLVGLGAGVVCYLGYRAFTWLRNGQHAHP